MSKAVTIREHVREALLDARPGGLTMTALAGVVKGPWRDRDVQDAVRRLWEINELGRRPDATFYVLDRPKVRNDKREGAPSCKLNAAAKRVGAEGRREGHDTRVRTRRVDPALLRAWCPRCQVKVLPRQDGTCPTCTTQTGANIEQPKPAPRRRRRRKPLRKGQPGYSTVCRCGAPKSKQAHTCRPCSFKRRRGRKLAGGERRRNPKRMTENKLQEARALYASGLSLRAVAAQIHPDTTYATVNSCAEALHSLFKTRGWKLRPQREVTVARNLKHGRKKRGRTNEEERAYRHWLANQRGWTAIQGPGRPMCKSVKVQPPGNGEPCDHRAQEGSDYCFSHDPKRALERQALTARMRARQPTKPILPLAPFSAWLLALHHELGTWQAVAERTGMSLTMANQRGITGNGRVIERIGIDVARRAAEHAGTTLEQIYGRGVDTAEPEAAEREAA
jgi:hypothetical protein